MRSALITATVLALGAVQHVQAQDAYIPERVATAVQEMQAPLVSAIKKYRYQPFCIAYLKCAPPSVADPTLTVTQSVATPTTITLSTGAGAIAIWEDEDLTMEGRATEVRNIAVETETTTHTTSIVVGKFTQTNTVTKTITAQPKMLKKRNGSLTEEDHAFAKRQAAACPALPTYLQRGDQPFKDYEWTWIVENACAAAIPTALPTPQVRRETRLVGPSIRYEQAPTTTWTIPGVRNILGTDTTTIYYTETERADTYEAVFSYTTKTATVTTTVTPRA